MIIRLEHQIFQMTKPRSEDQFQMATARYLNALEEAVLLAWFHPAPNTYRRGLAGPKNKRLAISLGRKGKAMGVRAGVPDCIIHSHRLAIELKYGKNSPTRDQQEWSTKATFWGWECRVCRTPEGVIQALVLAGLNRNQITGRR